MGDPGVSCWDSWVSYASGSLEGTNGSPWGWSLLRGILFRLSC